MTDGRRTTDGAEHLPRDRMAAFLDGALDGLAREAVVAHLAACAECRHELVELRGILHATQTPRRTLTRLSMAAGLAAVLAIVVLPRAARRPVSAPEPAPSATRAAAPVAAPTVAIVTPAPDGIVPAGAARLVWRAAGADAMYDVTIQDAEGSVAWRATVADTSVAVPATAALAAGRAYFWSVDARLADGHAVRSEIRSFSVRR